MKINFIALIIISYSLLNCCFGSGDRLPAACFHTPRQKKPIEFKPKIPAAAKKRLYFRLPKLINPSILLICPNSYEFKAVYEALKDKYKLKTCKRIKDYIFGDSNSFDKNLKDLRVEGIQPLYFFNINNVKICLALCGQRTSEIYKSSSKFQIVFKNLKTVILYGICGCSNPDTNVGSIILPSKYVEGVSAATGQPDEGTEVFLKNKSFYFKDKNESEIETNTKKVINTFLNTFRKRLTNTNINCFIGTNFSSEIFIRDDELVLQLIAKLDTSNICINTEDYTMAQNYKDIVFIPIRAVSDHAGLKDPNEILEGKKQACETLNQAALLTTNLIFKQKI